MTSARSARRRWARGLAITALVFAGVAPVAAFHFPWDQGHDTTRPDQGDDDNDPGDDACPPNTCCLDTRGSSPVEFASGNFVYHRRILRMAGLGPELDLTLTYNSRDNRKGSFGHGWVHEYDQRLTEVTDGVSLVAICATPNGKRERYVHNADGSFTAPSHLFNLLSKTADGAFELRDHRGVTRRFDTAGRLTAVVDRNGNTLSLTYDDAGFMTRITDAAGRTVLFTKGADGRVASVSDPARRVFRFEYDTAGNLVSLTDPLGHATAYEYDSEHNLARIVDGRGNTQATLAYDTEGRVRTHVDGAETWTYSYNRAARRTTKQDSQGRTWTIDYDERGTVTRLTDPFGKTELYAYDGNLNIVEFTDKGGRKTTSAYDLQGNRLSQTDPLGNTRRWTYEPGFNRVLSEADARGNSKSFAYDANGNLVSITDALGGVTSLAYDAKGQPTSISNAVGGVYAFDYDENGNVSRVTDPLGGVSEAEVDVLGKVIASTDPNGGVTRFEYDDAERLSRVTNAAGKSAQLAYDASGNLTTLTDPQGGVWTFEYDTLNHLTREIDPRGRVSTFTYDRRGNLQSRTDARGLIIRFSYDALNRLVTRIRPEDQVSFGYDAVGNLLSVVDADTAVTLAYDALNRLTEARTGAAAAQPATVIRYTYDADGNRLSMTDPGGITTAYEYDSLSRPLRLVDSSAGTFAFAYDALSRRITANRPDGLSTAYAYDRASRVTSIDHQGGPGGLRLAYAYDPAGNRLAMTDPSGAHVFSYDPLHALLAATHPFGNPPETFTYDAVGNRITSHLSMQYGYDAAQELIADDDFIYAHDASGNMIRKTRRSTGDATVFQYDSESQLVRIDFPGGGFAAYRYDGLGRRVEKNVSNQATAFVYDGERLVAEYAAGTLAARYVHGPGTDEVLAVVRDGVPSYYQTDAQRSVLRVVDGGAARATVAYDAFGQLVGETGDRRGPWAFQGREYDAESGLYYYRARYYDPRIGRFLGRDPIGHVAGMNRYAFVRNNPTTFTDPTGLYPGEDIVEFFPDAFGADWDFWQNYQDMRDANTIGADKYFHCKANCEGARRGPGGALESYLLSETRELFDEWIKGDPPSACNADRAANDHGRRAGRNNRNVDCRNACQNFRPAALDPRY